MPFGAALLFLFMHPEEPMAHILHEYHLISIQPFAVDPTRGCNHG